MKTIRDAVHGDMQFDEIEMSIIDSPAMQRLRGVKQLGTTSLVFPSAVHTRFEHGLGTAWIAKRILASLGERRFIVSDRDQRIVVLSALLHDVTHVPFGHTFEDERRLFDRHDEDKARLDFFLSDSGVAHALARSGVGDQVRGVLADEFAGSPFIRDIVKGTVCADLLDYLKRDAKFCGLVLDYDERLFHYFAIAEDRLVVRLHQGATFRRDALSELVHLLQIRYSLTERVYYHHAKIAAGAMISRALELAIDAGDLVKTDLYGLRDDSFLDRLSRMAARTPGFRELMDDVLSRRLFRRVYLLAMQGFGRPGLTPESRDELARRFHHDRDERGRIERAIAAELGVPEAHVILYCPSANMALKEADAPVEVSPGRVEPLSNLGHPDVAALREKHRGLWRGYVLLRREAAAGRPDAGKVCEKWIGHPNQLETHARGGLAFGLDQASPPSK